MANLKYVYKPLFRFYGRNFPHGMSTVRSLIVSQWKSCHAIRAFAIGVSLKNT